MCHHHPGRAGHVASGVTIFQDKPTVRSVQDIVAAARMIQHVAAGVAIGKSVIGPVVLPKTMFVVPALGEPGHVVTGIPIKVLVTAKVRSQL